MSHFEAHTAHRCGINPGRFRLSLKRLEIASSTKARPGQQPPCRVALRARPELQRRTAIPQQPGKAPPAKLSERFSHAAYTMKTNLPHAAHASVNE